MRERGERIPSGAGGWRLVAWALHLSLALALCPSSGMLAGQEPVGRDPPTLAPPSSSAAGELLYLSVNVLLGGLTGGVFQELRGGSFLDGFARGSLGGSSVYAGKRLSVESFAGAGLLGRQVAAVGSSVVRNASEGRPSLASIVLPVGPVHVHLSPTGADPTRISLDLADTYWVVYGLLSPKLSFRPGWSLSNGAPVFEARNARLAPGGDRVNGFTTGGVIFLSTSRRRTLPHEVVHVIQVDFVSQAWTGRLDEWLLDRLPVGGLRSSVHADVTFPAFLWSSSRLFGPEVLEPLEVEARFLDER